MKDYFKIILISILFIINIQGNQCKQDPNKLNFIEISDTFVKYFNERQFNNQQITSKLFNNISSDEWWMSGDDKYYSFVGWKTIGTRMNEFFPTVIGFDKWTFTEIDRLIDRNKHKIMLEIKAFGIGYGNRIYKNEYLFILSINQIGKIYEIKEYLDPLSILNYFLNNTLLEQYLNKFLS